MAKKTARLLPATENRLQQLGERLRLARLRRKLTAKQVAERSGMTVVTLRNLERGASGVTMGAYLAVMQVLGIERDIDTVAMDDVQGRELQDARLARPPRAAKPVATERSKPPDVAIRAVTTAKNPAAAPRESSRDWIAVGDFVSADALVDLIKPRPDSAHEKETQTMTDAFIAVYADWDGMPEPLRLGRLYARRNAGRELFEFEFDREVVKRPELTGLKLDPRLGLFEGRQYPPQGSETFGVFADASPDRWGRLLMRRRLERAQRAGTVDRKTKLYESDYLLGVHDTYRAGALRLRRNDAGEFLDNQHDRAAPPFVQLRALETASLALERDENNTADKGDQWLRLLIAPGGSLGGARPKASVVDPQGHLWIAKFPSVRDEHDVGAWEMVVHTLAKGCGLRVTEALVRRFKNSQHTFLVKRFDRTPAGRRLHFASAMNLTGHQDGDDASTGASYLEIARVLITDGARTEADLRELWSRIVFNVLVSNTDDHLRNHGFLLIPGKGWILSAAFDMNPVANAHGLTLNISEADNAMDLELARSVASYFRLSATDANDIIARQQDVVRQWPKIAAALKIPAREQERQAAAFRCIV